MHVSGSARRVAVIGGGPAGLFAARLLARDHSAWQITVHERLPPDDTFGFGVGLTPGLVRTLEEVDPEAHEAILAETYLFAGARFELPMGSAELGRFHAGAIGRSRLLQALLELATAAGVDVRIGETATVEELRAECDLVIAADGVSSASRASLVEELGAAETLGRGLFIWLGSDKPLDGTVFMPVETPDGVFVAHAYPYREDASTFVIEADEATLARAGCTQSSFPDDVASDAVALEHLTEVFSELLAGSVFIGNKSRWMRFRTVVCERWHHDNVVLLGDAKATAHPTLGSGTKLALEDAAALARALRDIDGEALAELLAEFERSRRPAVEHLQERAWRSQLWWESFSTRMDLAPSRLAVAYMSRAGAVSLQQLADSSPDLVRHALADWASLPPAEVPTDDLAEWVVNRRSNGAGPRGMFDATEIRPEWVVSVDCHDPWGQQGDAVLERAMAVRSSGAPLVALDGGPSRSALLDRLAMAERVRREAVAVVAVVADRDQLGDVADAVVAGRADAAVIRETARETTR